ncbi:MAG: DUF4340 domain-containing protein [Symploca sp. SIO2G7]|nr:DUF4340 domain-containing protein [Symploca sp. SIO2G7]
MKLQRSTSILLGVAIALVTTVAIIETVYNSRTDSGETLYEFTEDDVAEFTIKREGTTLSFTKTDDTWQMTAPQQAQADPASVAFLLNSLTSDTIEETISATPDQLTTYGLDAPMAFVELIANNESYVLSVGDEDFSGTSLYTMTAENTGDTDLINVYLMSKDLENGLERPLDEWLLGEDETNQAADENLESTSDENVDKPNDAETENAP